MYFYKRRIYNRIYVIIGTCIYIVANTKTAVESDNFLSHSTTVSPFSCFHSTGSSAAADLFICPGARNHSFLCNAASQNSQCCFMLFQPRCGTAEILYHRTVNKIIIAVQNTVQDTASRIDTRKIYLLNLMAAYKSFHLFIPAAVLVLVKYFLHTPSQSRHNFRLFRTRHTALPSLKQIAGRMLVIHVTGAGCDHVVADPFLEFRNCRHKFLGKMIDESILHIYD